MTTLIPALTNALSGLVTAKGAIDVISNNIANVNTEGYTRKIVQSTSITLGNQGVGVELAVVERLVDLKLQKDILRETGVLTQLDTQYEYYQAIQDLFGRPADNNSISHLLSDVMQRLQTVATSPTSAAAQFEAVEEVKTLATRFNSMSEQLQFLRVEADRAIETTVNEINHYLSTINNLNAHVQRAAAIGDTTADLEDQRDIALKGLAELIDIRINPQSDGTVMVFTNNGRPLIDVVGARLLTHESADALSADMTYAGSGIQDITWNNRDITTEIQSGKLKALIDMRDTVLPNLQAELDTLAKQFMDDINQIHNRGVGFPTLTTTLTGSRSFIDSSTQEMAFSSGNTLIAIYNSAGTVTNSITVQELMDNAGHNALSAGGGFAYTIDELASALNTWLDTTIGVGTAGIDSNGKLAVNITVADRGIAFKDLQTVNSPEVADPTAAMGQSGNLTFTNAAGDTVNFAVLAGHSLEDIQAAIDADPNFVASVVQTTSGNWRLVVASDSDVSVTSTVSNGANSWGIATGGVPDATIQFDSAWETADRPDTVASGFSNFFGLNDLFVDNRNNFIYDSPVRVSSWRSAAGELTFTDSTGTYPTPPAVVNVTAGMSLKQIADLINNDANLVNPSGQRVVTAAVVPEGGGYRLRITHETNGELAITGTAVSDLGLAASAANTSIAISVRSDVAADPSLMSRGTVRWNSDSAYLRYEMSEGDNTAVRAMVDRMSVSVSFASTGNIGAGKFTYTDFGAALLTVNARGAEVAKQKLDYQKPLNEGLNYRHKNLSGVNLDEEMASLIIYQQAYQAAARVISVTEKMMDVLENMMR